MLHFMGKEKLRLAKSFRKMQHMNIKDGLLKIRVQRLQGPVFKSTDHSVSFDKSKCRCCAKLPHRCSATLLVACTEHPHQGSCMPIQRVFPSPGRTVSHVLQKHGQTHLLRESEIFSSGLHFCIQEPSPGSQKNPWCQFQVLKRYELQIENLSFSVVFFAKNLLFDKRFPQDSPPPNYPLIDVEVDVF